MANNVNVASLTKYVDQLGSELIAKAILESKLLSQITVQTGVTYTAALNNYTSTLTLADGGCGTFTGAGGGTLSQETITVVPIKAEESICPTTLNQYWMDKKRNGGKYWDTNADEFNRVFNADKVATISKMVTDLAWQGNTALGSGNLSKTNGFLKLAGTVSGVVHHSLGSPLAPLVKSTTIATIDGIIDTAVSSAPVILGMEDITMYMAQHNFLTLTRALRDANNFFIDGTKGVDFELMYPGTRIKVVGDPSFGTRNEILLTPSSNLVLGTDMSSDYEQYQMWEDMNSNEIRFRAQWKQGHAFRFPQYVVFAS